MGELTVLDLFSGIGGFSLGLERAGMRTVAFCERDEKAIKVLNKHWPNVPVYRDIKRLNGTLLLNAFIKNPSVITAGFPCPAFSMIGKRKGFEQDPLFFEVTRLVKELKPKYVLLENVEGFKKWRREALNEIENIGYEWIDAIFDARDFGIPQARRRWFAICVQKGVMPDSQYLRGIQGVEIKNLHGVQSYFEKTQRGWVSTVSSKEEWRTISPNPRGSRSNNGVRGGLDRLNQLGNSLCPVIPEFIGNFIKNYEDSQNT